MMKSKTKEGATVIGAGAVIATLGALVTGNVGIIPGIAALVIEVGAVWFMYGLRDTPLFNRTK